MSEEKTNGPWKIKSSSVRYKNPWMEVVEDDVIRPDGKHGIYGKINMMPGVAVLPIDNKGFVYLIREFKYAIGEYSIEVICGGVESEENILTAAKRELREETGITANEFINLGELHSISNLVKSSTNIFIAKDLTLGEPDREGTEVMETLKMPLEDAVKMVMDGKIQHAPSCVLILKADRILKKG